MKSNRKMYDEFGFNGHHFCKDCRSITGDKKTHYTCQFGLARGILNEEDEDFKSTLPACGKFVCSTIITSPQQTVKTTRKQDSSKDDKTQKTPKPIRKENPKAPIQLSLFDGIS